MLAKNYAKALYEVSLGKSDAEKEKLFQNFLLILKREGCYKLLPKILNNFEELSREDEMSSKLIVANEGDVSKYKDQIESYKEYVGEGGADLVVDETVVGGFVLRTSDVLIDASHKKALVGLYKKFVS